MALNMDSLAGAIVEIVGEERPFEDSWGMPGLKVTGVVLRADHPTWQQHILDLMNARPEAKKQRAAVNERIYSPFAPRGFRRNKQTEAEAYNRMLVKVSEQERLQIRVHLLRDQKEGIARILCRDLRINGESRVERGGTTYDLSTVEGRIGFMNHELWEFDQNGERVEIAVGIYKRDANGELVRDEAGEPVRNEEGGWNLGDGIASLLLGEAEETEKFVRTRKADALEQSAGASIGPSASGSASMSADAES